MRPIYLALFVVILCACKKPSTTNNNNNSTTPIKHLVTYAVKGAYVDSFIFVKDSKRYTYPELRFLGYRDTSFEQSAGTKLHVETYGSGYDLEARISIDRKIVLNKIDSSSTNPKIISLDYLIP